MCQSPSEDKGCSECDYRGWVHSSSPFQIERHDACDTFSSDEEAQAAHTLTCNCDWPPFDYQDAFMAWLERDTGEPMAPVFQKQWDKLCELGSDRDTFVKNLGDMKTILELVMMTSHLMTTSVKDLKRMMGALGILYKVSALIHDKRWKNHWIGSVDDGTYNNTTKRWYVNKEVSSGQTQP